MLGLTFVAALSGESPVKLNWIALILVILLSIVLMTGMMWATINEDRDRAALDAATAYYVVPSGTLATAKRTSTCPKIVGSCVSFTELETGREMTICGGFTLVKGDAVCAK